MRTELVSEIKDLEAREVYISDEMERVGNTVPYDSYQFSALKGEHETVQAKLTAKREELQKISDATETAQIELLDSLDSLNIPGSDKSIPLSLLLMTEDISLEDKIYIITTAIEQKLINAAVVNTSLETEKEAWKARYHEIDRKQNETELRCADFETKLRNATDQIEEQAEELKRSGAEIEKLREQLTTSTLPTPNKLTTSTPESLQDVLAKRPAIYNVRWEPVVGPQTHKLANLADTDEEIRYHYFNEGIYRILNEEELLQFRKEKADREHEEAAEAERLAQEAIQHIPLVIPTLPSEGSEHGLDETNESLEVAERPVSREEFNQLASRVAQIEQSAYRVA